MPTIQYTFTTCTKVHVIVSGHQRFVKRQKHNLIYSSDTWCTLCHSNIIHVATTSSTTFDKLN